MKKIKQLKLLVVIAAMIVALVFVFVACTRTQSMYASEDN